MRGVLLLSMAIVWMALTSPDALAANRAVFTDKGGDACCTEDIRRVVVSNDDAGTITFSITAPVGDEGGASDRFIEIETERGEFVIGTNPNGEGYALWQGAAAVMLGRVDASHRGDVFHFVIDRHRLGDTDRFMFGVAFWRITSLGGANHDDAPDVGKWPYRVKLALGGVRTGLGVRQRGSRLSAALALHVGNELLGSGAIVCAAGVRGRALRLLRREFVARRAVCVWEVPRWAHGKVVRGVIGVRVTAAPSSLRRRSFRLLLA